MTIDFRLARRPLLVLLVAGAAACSSGTNQTATAAQPASVTSAPSPATGATSAVAGATPVIDPGDGGNYRPELVAADFVDVIDNPYLPFPDGATWRYEGTSDGEPEIIEVMVTGERTEILGISATVVRDTVTIGGKLVEDTYDWYAQDKDGNVWYLGEDVKDYEDGKVVSTAGSWRAGVDGALPGIVMPGEPQAGAAYRQEYLAGEAEDMMAVLDAGSGLAVGDQTYDDVIRTRDWTPLEPDVVEEKAYAAGVGKISERKTVGGDGFAELVATSLTR